LVLCSASFKPDIQPKTGNIDLYDFSGLYLTSPVLHCIPGNIFVAMFFKSELCMVFVSTPHRTAELNNLSVKRNLFNGGINDNQWRYTMKLLDQVRMVIRTKHFKYTTEQTYVGWIKRYIIYHGKKHPLELGADDVSRFLSYLATDLKVAASTQNQALNSIVFLYRHVLGKDIGDFGQFIRAKRPKLLPTVLTVDEIREILLNLKNESNRVSI
jgi:hypothetical protein